MSNGFRPVRNPKIDVIMHIESIESGMKSHAKISREFDGIYFKFRRFEQKNGLIRPTSRNILITVEDKFDAYDLQAVNEILRMEKLSFIKYDK